MHYAADVSVMESLGDPSLLVEGARNEQAMAAGAGRASFEGAGNAGGASSGLLDGRDPELASLVRRHWDGCAASPGLMREETAFRDPYGFYEHAARSLLAENELEKVRLLGSRSSPSGGGMVKINEGGKEEEEAGCPVGLGLASTTPLGPTSLPSRALERGR